MKRVGTALRPLLLVLALPLLMAGECEEPLVKDSSFDLWCGDMLCAWQRDAGTVAKVPTWNERDYGVELVDASTQISQLLSYSSTDVSCIHFDLLANIDASASVTLQLDFDDDGSVDATQALTTGAWTPMEYHWVTPTYFHSVRLSIRKDGAGHAVLARIQASKATNCQGAPPLGAVNRPTGATCERTSQCGTDMCRPRPIQSELIPDATSRSVCAACADDGDCGPAMVCGLAWSPAFIEPYPACIAPPALSLGQRCIEDGACATGLCTLGVCSACRPGSAPPCDSTASCTARPTDVNGYPLRPAFQCSPGQGLAAAQAPCLGDSDCAGGHCTATGGGGGTLNVCAADGRSCATAADCPAPDQNPCLALGVSGGRCD